MKIRTKNIVFAVVLTTILIISLFFLQVVFYNDFLKHEIRMEIKKELKKYQQERIEKLRKQLKYNQRKC